MKIFKYTFDPEATVVNMPAHAQVISAGVCGTTGLAALWASVDPDVTDDAADRAVMVVKTGADVPSGMDLAGRVDVGAARFHVFVGQRALAS